MTVTFKARSAHINSPFRGTPILRYPFILLKAQDYFFLVLPRLQEQFHALIHLLHVSNHLSALKHSCPLAFLDLHHDLYS